MLLRMLRGILSPRVKAKSAPQGAEDALHKADSFVQQGDLRSAIIELRRYLEQFPTDVTAINNLGCYLSDVGDEAGASVCFELAYRLDDSFLPGIVNHAKFSADQRRSQESLRFLREAKARETGPGFGYTDSVYAGVALSLGDIAEARRYGLRARLASFDRLRFANCYLFYCAYDDLDEATLAAEHKFWGETLAPIELCATDQDKNIDLSEFDPPPQKSAKTIRIGYWSPDFRNHSVRYFFRPLLDNHDRTQFEVFLYHDIPVSDAQTEEIRKNADRFFDVGNCPDRKLISLIKSHELDVLVELAAHTSTNRLHLLQQRLATIQVSGIGYPPTTGLSTIDAKILDAHTSDAQSDHYYTEAPLVLPTSFWCYDPYDDAPIALEVPTTKNGYVTFACVGNIAKISQRIIQCWVKILGKVPNSKLMLRSISFNDEAAMQICHRRMMDAGILPERLILCKPEGGAAFFASYNDIDIVLDTFPFNGGTTTCFATYMGVPVVSLAGKSLISRMGKSILANLEMSDWSVESDEAYVDKAVNASSDLGFLTRFRAEARERFRKTALGNGKLFAQEFESACSALLEKKKKGTWNHSSCVPDLPPEELIQRAYSVLNTGQEAAARRIVDYCLRAHPNFGPAHILWTRHLTVAGDFRAAADYLMQRLDSFHSDTRVAALINVARSFLLLSDCLSAKHAIEKALTGSISDETDAAQVKLLESVINVIEADDDQLNSHGSVAHPINISILVVSDEGSYASIVNRIRTVCLVPENVEVKYIHCPEEKKGKSLNSALYDSTSDFVVWINKNVSICNPTFFVDVFAALEHCDVVGFSGAATFDRIDWRRCEAPHRVGSNLSPSGEKNGWFEIQVVGCAPDLVVGGMSILDGALFVFSPSRVKERGEFVFDPFLESAATLMEEYFSYQCHGAGLRLSVHQGLGVVVNWQVPLLSDHLGEARWHLAQKLEFDPFKNLPEDRTIISAPVNSAELGFKVQRTFFARAKNENIASHRMWKTDDEPSAVCTQLPVTTK